MINHYNNLWVEKYRPKTLDDIVLDPEIKEHFKNIGDDVPNILFHGPAGTGKSTMAKVIVKDILKCQYLYINASDENGIDTIRNKVITFAQTRSIDSKKKIVILEEADGLTGDSLRILRNVMEEYINTTRFILTANYITRIIEPIRSRCVMFKLQPSIKGCGDRCVEILKKENITVDDSDKSQKFLKFLKRRFPDLRRIINDLQKCSVGGIFKFPEDNDSLDFSGSIIEGLLGGVSSLEIRKNVIESESLFDGNYQQLLKSIFDYVYNSKKFNERLKKQIMLDLGEHMYRDNLVLDHEINFFCCLLAIESSLNIKP